MHYSLVICYRLFLFSVVSTQNHRIKRGNDPTGTIMAIDVPSANDPSIGNEGMLLRDQPSVNQAILTNNDIPAVPGNNVMFDIMDANGLVRKRRRSRKSVNKVD